MSVRPRVLDELGLEVERAAHRTLGGKPPRRRYRVRPAGALALLVALLLLAAAATAAVLLIQRGSPLPAPHGADLRASGVPLAGTARLAGLDVPDPDASQPPWDLRISRTAGGETCTAVGQVVGGRLGIVGLDHVFRALPPGGADACGIDTPSGPVLAGAQDFLGPNSGEARTVVSGVAGPGARSVTAYAGGEAAPRRGRQLHGGLPRRS
jgi:hypothetical protein